MSGRQLTLLLGLAICQFCGDGLRADEVTFRNDVMAVLSKAGCNQGVCHGNKHGKGGFRLSLRGDDPRSDYEILTRSTSARRINRVEPEQSLILLKATMQIAHEGGRRFDADSPEYRILHDWISGGTADRGDAPQLVELTATPQRAVLTDPEDEVQLRAEALFSDGSRRDVTQMAVYEPANPIVEVDHNGRVSRQALGETVVMVRYLNRQVPVELAFIPDRPDFEWTGPAPSNLIDRHVFEKLRSLRINPSPVCDDTTFVRRVYFDLLGIPPTAKEARQFVSDDQPDKRGRLVDQLLERPEFADYWAQKWSDVLRNEEKTLDRKGVQNFYAWIRGSIAREKPVDQFVRELVAARGSTYEHPPANFYRSMRDPLTRAEAAAQVFLGVRLQCAKCHSHPFDRWTQDDYYGWANFFSRVRYKIVENKRRDRNDKHEFNGEQIVYWASKGEVTNAKTGSPTPPRFLGDDDIDRSDRRERLDQLAEWITSRKNRQFARAQVNFIWYHLLGRGIVHPIDDFRATNPPSNPALLNALSDQFVESGFDLKQTIRAITASQIYQLSSVPNATNADDEANFSRALIRRLTAEQMLDAMSAVTGGRVRFNGYPAGMRAGELPGVRAVRRRDKRPSLGDQFLKLFGKPQRLTSCTCERTEDSTMGQTFQMVSGPMINELLTQEQNRITGWETSAQAPAEIVDDLFWSALSRPPSPEESGVMQKLLQSTTNQRRTLEDLTWSILNSDEFLFRR